MDGWRVGAILLGAFLGVILGTLTYSASVILWRKFMIRRAISLLRRRWRREAKEEAYLITGATAVDTSTAQARRFYPDGSMVVVGYVRIYTLNEGGVFDSKNGFETMAVPRSGNPPVKDL